MGPAKLQKAEKLGVTILSESDFVEIINGKSAPAEGEKREKVIQTSLF
jgi:BRCT domain type II-containing protein